MRQETPEKVIRDVGRRIAELRRAKAWTQDQLAERMEVSVQYLRRIEGGRENLTLRSLVETARVLGLRAKDLLTPPRSRKVTTGRPKRPAST